MISLMLFKWAIFIGFNHQMNRDVYADVGNYLPKASCFRLSVCPSVRPCMMKFVSGISYHLRNRLCKFHHIYNLNTVGDRDELIRF